MESLRRKRSEVACASEESELLARLRAGTSEYDLIRRVDLSYDSPELTALHYRSYMRLSQETAAIPRYDGNQYGHDYTFISFYHNELASLYYTWACHYLDHGRQLDAAFHLQENPLDPQYLVNDASSTQRHGLLMVTFATDFEKIAELFHQRGTLEEYKEHRARLGRVIQIVQHSTSHKKDMFLQQLTALQYFYDQLCLRFAEYQRLIPHKNGQTATPQNTASTSPISQNTQKEALQAATPGEIYQVAN